MADKARAKVPDSVVAGETFTVKTLFRHRMETGHRPGDDGALVPRDIVARFEARYDVGDGAPIELFAVDLGTGIAANPFFEFDARVARSGTLTLRWVDDAGEVTELVRDIAVRG